MSANPSTRWFWNDWDNDQGLKLCSFAAQGLWMRMLSIAVRSGGYLRVGGKNCNDEDVARIVGHPIEEVSALIAELATNRVFSKTRTGATYCRRLVDDESTRKRNQTNGRLGGNPNLRKQITNPSPINRKTNPPDKPPLNGGGSPLSHLTLNPSKKEARGRAQGGLL